MIEAKDKLEIRMTVLEELDGFVGDVFIAIDKYREDTEEMKNAVSRIIKNQTIEVEARKYEFAKRADLAHQHRRKKTEI